MGRDLTEVPECFCFPGCRVAVCPSSWWTQISSCHEQGLSGLNPVCISCLSPFLCSDLPSSSTEQSDQAGQSNAVGFLLSLQAVSAPEVPQQGRGCSSAGMVLSRVSCSFENHCDHCDQLRKSLCSLQLLAQPAQECLAGGQLDINAFLFLFHLSYCVALWSESSPNLEVLNLMLWLWKRQIISCLTFVKTYLLGFWDFFSFFCLFLLLFFVLINPFGLALYEQSPGKWNQELDLSQGLVSSPFIRSAPVTFKTLQLHSMPL